MCVYGGGTHYYSKNNFGGTIKTYSIKEKELYACRDLIVLTYTV